jgi:RNA polymerase sigma factor (sigma-70 family)
MTATLTRTPARTLTRLISTAAVATAAADQNDRDLVARMGGGDRAAWGELYRRHRATVIRYVARRVAVEADVEDLVHEASLHAWDMAGEYRPEHGYAVRSWLCGRAGQAVRRYSWNDRHAYHAAVDATREALRRPVTETAAEREARALSEPVAAAVAGLAPAERQAITLRYLDGLSEAQAAEVRGCTGRAIRSSAEAGRRKLTGALADLAPEARSPLQEMPRREVARIALATVGYDNVPAAQEWLRDRGVRVSTTTLYEARRAHDRAKPGTHIPAAAVGEHRPARPAYTPPEDVTTLPPSDRARAAGRDYRTRHGRLPSISQLADATGVAPATAARALRQLKTDHHAQSEPTADTAHPGTGSGRQAGTVDTQPARPGSRREHASPRQDGEHEALTRRQQPDTTGAATVPVVERAVDRYADRRRPGEDQARGPLADPATARHRVRAHSQAAPTGPAARDDATRHRHATSRTVGDDTTAKHDTSTAPPAEVSIARARVALAVLTAHRAEQAQRHAVEQARVEQLNRWHHDDHDTTGRDDGEGHER